MKVAIFISHQNLARLAFVTKRQLQKVAVQNFPTLRHYYV